MRAVDHIKDYLAMMCRGYNAHVVSAMFWIFIIAATVLLILNTDGVSVIGKALFGLIVIFNIILTSGIVYCHIWGCPDMIQTDKEREQIQC